MTGAQGVDARLVLSASGRTLAVVPVVRLSGNARYRVEAAGLVDVYGGAVVLPPTTFVTRADEAPEYDVTQLVLGFRRRRLEVQRHLGSSKPSTNGSRGSWLWLAVPVDVALTVVQARASSPPAQFVHLEAIPFLRVDIITRVEIHAVASREWCQAAPGGRGLQ